MSRTGRAVPVAALTTMLTTVLTTTLVGGAHAGVDSRIDPRSASPGFAGSRITLFSHGEFSGYDALTTNDGTTYVGWISDNNTTTTLRQVHLCVLKLSSRSCVGGVQDADALGDSTAQDLQVVQAGGSVELVWIYQDLGSGDFSGTFGVARVSGGTLGSSTSVPGAPTYGELTAVMARGTGVSAAVVGSGANFNKAYYYPDLSSSPATLKAPFPIGNAQIAATSTKTVMTVSHYGSIGDPVRYAVKGAGAWSGFKTVKRTWTVGNIERLISTRAGIRLSTATNSASYQPVVAKFNGSTFGKPIHTGDRNSCSPSSHDVVVDGSGRLVDVANECGTMAISNLARTTKAGIVRVPEGGTQAGGPPQITTTPSGRGWAVWGIESTGVANNLYARRIVLPALLRRTHDHSAAGRLTLIGPSSCMPVSTTHVKVKVKGARHWTVTAKNIKLGHHAIKGKLKGASLKPHHRYRLVGTAKLRNGGRHATLMAKLVFKTCGRP